MGFRGKVGHIGVITAEGAKDFVEAQCMRVLPSVLEEFCDPVIHIS